MRGDPPRKGMAVQLEGAPARRHATAVGDTVKWLESFVL
jgi:hypothetical protein